MKKSSITLEWATEAARDSAERDEMHLQAGRPVSPRTISGLSFTGISNESVSLVNIEEMPMNAQKAVQFKPSVEVQLDVEVVCRR